MIKQKKRNNGFTLSEVLITLAVIGIVAAMTLPAFIQKYQQFVLKNQFKQFYSNFSNAIKYVQATNGGTMSCYYWDKHPYEDTDKEAKCSKYNEYGNCAKWVSKDDTPLVSNYNGELSECKKFTEELTKALKAIKVCNEKALENGCITNSYRGRDIVLAEKNPDQKIDPNIVFSDKNIKNKSYAFIAGDGTLYVKYNTISSFPIFLVDINGHKGPNKYGYDLFIFELHGNPTAGIYQIKPNYWTIEKGGTTFEEMLKNF